MTITTDICGMHILLAAATTFEIQPTIDAVSPSDAGTFASYIDTPPSSGADYIISLITGVGSIATTWSLMRQFDRMRPDLVIQAGIAGCFTDKAPGEVLVVKEEILADLGVWEDRQFKTLFDLKLTNPDNHPFKEGRLPCPYPGLLDLTGLEPVTGVTVNEISTDPHRIRWLQQNTNAVVESMEGGALHYVCLQENIPFLQLRAVSNAIGVRDKTKWDIRSAIGNLNQQLIRLLQQLNTEEDQTILIPTY